jgi:hypothetical protein
VFALATGPALYDQTNDNYVYSAPVVTPGAEDVSCIRNVVVDYEAGEGDPRPRGIVTSFNSVIP